MERKPRMRDKPFRGSLIMLVRMSALVCAYVMAAAAVANNNLFLPGDTFFPPELTEESLRQLEEGAEDPPVFERTKWTA